MKRIYQYWDYESRKPVEAEGKGLVGLLTSKKDRALILLDDRGNPKNPGFLPLAVNYGTQTADRAPFLRGIQVGEEFYEIARDPKQVVHHPDIRKTLFYDTDRIPYEKIFVVKGKARDILTEFRQTGYRVVEE